MITRVRITAQKYADRFARGNLCIFNSLKTSMAYLGNKSKEYRALYRTVNDKEIQGFADRWARGNLKIIKAVVDGGKQEKRPDFQPSPKAPTASVFKEGRDAYWGIDFLSLPAGSTKLPSRKNTLYLPFYKKEVESMSPEQLSYAKRWARGNKAILYRFLGKALYAKIFKEDTKRLFGQ